jgi:hypothetical protein
MSVGERRDGALLSSGCGKWRAMAAGVQVVPVRHSSAAKQKGHMQRAQGHGWTKARSRGTVS